ncbi:hypothetical protein [Deinococcus knuensis]|uniref:hypothetical protein n=1 Tax=Deinococcus knuensis TaxID=1837380 RepID=UPI00166C8B15|nr:hypothetical protein [Deinococcus knuensis]
MSVRLTQLRGDLALQGCELRPFAGGECAVLRLLRLEAHDRYPLGGLRGTGGHLVRPERWGDR